MAGFSIKKTGSWIALRARFMRARQEMRLRQWLAVRRAALLAERELKKGIINQAPGGKRFKPLSAVTRLLKGSSKALIDTGALLGSITTLFDQESMSAFVGVHRMTRGRDGQSLLNLAIVHEFGTKPFVIKVTPAMRRFFWMLHVKSRGKIRPLGSKTEIMHSGVPARPFVRPTADALRGKLGAVLVKTFTEKGGPL